MKKQYDLDKSMALVKRYIDTDKTQEALLLELLEAAKNLNTDDKRSCVELVNELGGPCNHYFDLTDAIKGNE
jgi:hypothetical protein